MGAIEEIYKKYIGAEHNTFSKVLPVMYSGCFKSAVEAI
jgi:hypothetical protein